MKDYFYSNFKQAYILTILFGLLLASSCKDEMLIERPPDDPPVLRDCTFDFTAEAINNDTSYLFACPQQSFDVTYTNRYQYEGPVFNPNNKNQIAYFRLNTDDIFALYELFTFDFCTGTIKKIADNAFYGLDWSAKDWISFTGYDGQIYKIKSDGTELTQLTFEGNNDYAQWNETGDLFAYQKNNTNHNGFKIANEAGATVDSLDDNFHLSRARWTKDYFTHPCSDSFCIALVNATTKEYQEYKGESDWVNPRIIFYLEKTNQLLWGNLAIGTMDLTTNANPVFYNSAGNRLVSLYDVSRDEETILIERTNIKKITECHREVDSAIYLMDINGENERRVLIPE